MVNVVRKAKKDEVKEKIEITFGILWYHEYALLFFAFADFKPNIQI